MTAWSTIATVTVEVLLNGVWTDISGYVLAERADLDVNTGRQNELAQGQPGRLGGLMLDNNDGRFTPGNTLSPYYPYWRAGARIRYRETIGARTFDLFDGYLQMPETVMQTEGLNQTVTVTAVDRLERLGRSRTLLSTLGEHIRYHGANLLQAYYPLGDAGSPVGDVVASREGMQPVEDLVTSPSSLTPSGAAEISYGADTIAPGDDLPTTTFSVSTVEIGGQVAVVTTAYLLGAWGSVLPQSAGELVTLVVWVSVEDEHDGWMVVADIGGVDTAVTVSRDQSTQVWTATIGDFGGGLSGTITGPRPRYGSPTILGIQFGFTPDVFTLWVDDDEYHGTLTGSAPASTSYDAISTGFGVSGTVGHYQVYKGAYTHDDFLAQREAGLNGLYGSRSDEWISATAPYAGVATGELVLDEGAAIMQHARMAGRRVTDVWDDAVTTERGRLFVSGDGHLTFHNRVRTSYNFE